METKESVLSEKQAEKICLTKKQISYGVSFLLVILGGFFLAGFFLGNYYAIKEYSEVVRGGCFEEQLENSLRLMGLISEFNEGESREGEGGAFLGVARDVSIKLSGDDAASSVEVSTIEAGSDSSENGEELLLVQPQQGWRAAILGGTQAACSLFVDQLQKEFGVQVEIVKKVGKNKKGRETTWFQVITPVYTDRASLDDFLLLLEKRHGIRKPYIWKLENN